MNLSNKIETANGVKINVEYLGGMGKPVVFIHGWPVNHKMFEYQFTELPKHGYRCIGMDLRGFGDSDKPWNGYNYDSMADDMRVVLDTLNIKKLALLGAAAPCFTKRPDFPHGIDKSAVDDLIQQTYADRPSMLKNFSQLFFQHPENLSAEFNIWNLSLGLAASAYATIHCAVELRDADLRKDLASIQIPTLILHGTDDRVCLFDLAKKMNEGIKGSQLIPVENAGHGFYYEQREKVNSELVRFIG